MQLEWSTSNPWHHLLRIRHSSSAFKMANRRVCSFVSALTALFINQIDLFSLACTHNQPSQKSDSSATATHRFACRRSHLIARIDKEACESFIFCVEAHAESTNCGPRKSDNFFKWHPYKRQVFQLTHEKRGKKRSETAIFSTTYKIEENVETNVPSFCCWLASKQQDASHGSRTSASIDAAAASSRVRSSSPFYMKEVQPSFFHLARQAELKLIDRFCLQFADGV